MGFVQGKKELLMGQISGVMKAALDGEINGDNVPNTKTDETIRVDVEMHEVPKHSIDSDTREG